MNLRLSGLRWLRGQSYQGVIGAVYTGAAFAAFHADPGPTQAWIAGATVLVGLLAWGASLRRARAIANLPTSRIVSAAQGYVELQGRTRIDALVYSPLSNTPCIWYRYRVYERDAADQDWREVDSGVSENTFELDDGSACCTVDPDYAEVVGAEVNTRVVGDTKEVEEYLHGGRTLYALGEFSTVGGAHSALDLRADVSALLTRWKQDRAALLKRFDLNHDGEIDLQEWELARRLAQRTVEKDHQQILAQPGVAMLAAPRDGRLFLLSALSPQRLRQRYLLWSALHLSVSVLAMGALGHLL